MINVLVVEDQAMVRGALSALLDLENDIQVVATAVNGIEALDICENQTVDVVVSDIEMPEMNGLQLAKALNQKRQPAKVIILTTFSKPGYVQQAMDAGIGAYLLKDAPSEELAQAIRQVLKGDTLIPSQLLTDTLKLGSNPLTPKEQNILSLAHEGKSSKEISDQLVLSCGTVRNYIHSACQKLQSKNRIEAAKIALDNGWLMPRMQKSNN